MGKFKLNSYHAFMMAFLIYFISRYFEYTTFVKIPGLSSAITYLKLFSYILAITIWIFLVLRKGKLSFRYFFIILLILIYFIYQAFVNNRNTIFVVVLFSLIFNEKYTEKFIKQTCIISSVLYIATIVSCLMGFIENVITNREKFNTIWSGRAMGFTYQGQMVMMLIPIVFMYYYLKKDKICWKDNIIWILADIAVFLQCKTIMGFVLILIFILLFNYVNIRYIRGKTSVFQMKWITYSPYIFFSMTVFFLVLYKKGSPLGLMIDTICNGRFNLGNIIIKAYGIKFFGTRFVNNATYYYEIIDSEYIHMIVGEGLLYLGISLILGRLMMKYAYKEQDVYLSLILLLIFFNAIFNNGIYNLVMNPFGILLVASIRHRYKKERYREKRNVGISNF